MFAELHLAKLQLVYTKTSLATTYNALRQRSISSISIQLCRGDRKPMTSLEPSLLDMPYCNSFFPHISPYCPALAII